MRVLSSNEVNPEKWNQCILSSSRANAFGLFEYLDAVSEDWDALIWGDYEAVCPLPFKKKLNFRWLVSPVYLRETGVYFSDRTTFNENDLYSEMDEYIRGHFGRIDYYLPLRGNEENKIPYQFLEANDYDTLYKGYSTNIKRLLKKAPKVDVYKGSWSDVIQLFKKEVAEKLDDYSEEDLVTFESLITALDKSGFLSCFVCREEDKIIAFGLFVFVNKRVLYLKGAANSKGKKSGAMAAIFDFVIQKYVASGSDLDFGGSSVDSIATFFKKFGATDNYYLCYRYKSKKPIHSVFNFILDRK